MDGCGTSVTPPNPQRSEDQAEPDHEGSGPTRETGSAGREQREAEAACLGVWLHTATDAILNVTPALELPILRLYWGKGQGSTFMAVEPFLDAVKKGEFVRP